MDALLAAEEMPSMAELLAVLLICGFFLYSVVLHEVAHGWVAERFGDPTARDAGRITLDPVAHIDPFLSLVLPALLLLTTGFIFGGAKPVPVEVRNLRPRIAGDLAVSLAGVAANLALAALAAALLRLPFFAGSDLAKYVLLRVVILNVLLVLFNLLPIPPLDGSRVFKYLLPVSWQREYEELGRYGLLIVAFLVFCVPAFQDALERVVLGCAHLFLPGL
jgi:Zn-dependent protease